MSYFDMGLIVIIAGFALAGLWYGLVNMVVSLIGTIAGIYLATRFYSPISTWIINTTGWDQNLARVVIFIAVFIIILKLVEFIFWIIKKILGIVTKLPGIHGLDRLLGMIFGLIEAVLILGIIFYFVARFPISSWFMTQMAQSRLVPYLVQTVTPLFPLIPDALKLLKSTVDKII